MSTYYITILKHPGVIDEAAEFVKALTRNGALQNAFITVIQTPGNSLQKLSKEVRMLWLSVSHYCQVP